MKHTLRNLFILIFILFTWAVSVTALFVFQKNEPIMNSSQTDLSMSMQQFENQENLDGILTITPPVKTSYYLGEPLDLTGFSAVLLKPDQTRTDVTSLVTFNGDAGIVGEHEIIVCYGDQTAAFSIQVSRRDEPKFTGLDTSGDKKNIMVIGTGGTIAGLANQPTSFQTYTPGMKTIESMVSELPDIQSLANVKTYQFGNSSSSSYSLSDLYDLSVLADQYLQSYDGVVITCGTDTLEEIAYFLDITLQSSKPVVVTAAMRPWNVISSDGPANLYNAILLAASGKTARFGTVVVINDEIHSARDITKTNSDRLDTFESPMVGILGYIDEGKISIYRKPLRYDQEEDDWKTPFDLTKINKKQIPRVEIVLSYQDAGAEAISAYTDCGVKGIVTAGTGAGGISQAMLTARSEAIKRGVVFMMTTRTGSGTLYSSSGSLIAGDNLSPYKARIFLAVALAFSQEPAQLREWASRYAAVRE